MSDERKIVAIRGGRQDSTGGEIIPFLQDLLKRARNGEILGVVAGWSLGTPRRSHTNADTRAKADCWLNCSSPRRWRATWFSITRRAPNSACDFQIVDSPVRFERDLVMLWLDHKLFGNGYGMKSPYFDDTFYWLSGRLYQWIGGYGAQLRNRQWFRPLPGEERVILGRRFRPFRSSRCGPRVEVSWEMIELPKGLDEAKAAINDLREELRRI